MVRPLGILLPLAVLAAVQSGDVSRSVPDTHPLRPELARLVMEVGRNRLIEARLTGGFSYGRWRPGDAVADVLGRRVLAAAFDVIDSGSPLTDPATQAALGSAYLLAGRTREAVTQLERAVADAGSQPFWYSDLAAAYLTRGDRESQFGDYVSAMAMAARAIDRAPRMAEAWFNRALAMERLAPAEAAEAWADYLAIDRTSGFAAEAVARRESRLSRAGNELPPRPDTGSLDAPELAPYFQWAAAAIRGDTGGMSSALASAQPRARSGLERSDHFHADVVEDLRRAASDPVMLRRVAGGLRALQDGHAAAAGDAVGEASAHFRRAARALAADSAALAAVADFRDAIGAYYDSRHDDARRRLIGVEIVARERRYGVLQARALRVIGLIHATAGRYGPALETYRAALRCAEQAGAAAQAAALNNLIAEVFDYLGETSEGWNSRGRALMALGAVADAGQRQSILVSAALAALQEGYPESAAALQRTVEATAREFGSDPDVAESWILRARIERALGNSAKADEAIAAGADATARVGDPALRGRVEAELSLARSASGTWTAGGIDASLEYFSATDALSRLTEVYYARAQARATFGDPAGERHELEQALRAFDRRASALSDEERRLTHDLTGRRLYEGLIDLAVRGGDPIEGLAALDRYHTRLQRPAAPAPRIEASLRPPANQAGAVVAYASLRDRLILWIGVPGTAPYMIDRPIGRERLAALIDAFAEAVTLNQREDALSVGRLLFTILLAPLTGLDTDRVWLIPDGPLHRLPFAALPDPATGRFAVERWALALKSTVSGEIRASSQPPGGGALIVGNPRVPGAASLPEAEQEAVQISRLHPNAIVLTGEAATSDAVTAAIRTAPVLHFGGHAVVNQARPLLSRLQLAPGGSANTGDLFVYDLQRMELRHMRLAVLAACRSADARAGAADGVVSLAAALLSRGVGTVVASLFDLDDRTARELFVRFHEAYRRTGDEAASLRVAQLEQVERGPSAMMRDWAGVVVIQR